MHFKRRCPFARLADCTIENLALFVYELFLPAFGHKNRHRVQWKLHASVHAQP